MQGIKIELNQSSPTFYACAQKNGQKSLEIEKSDGKITVNAWYSYSEKPLTLTADDGEKITIILDKHHVSFKAGDFYVVSRLIYGDYIKYEQIIC